MNWVKKMNEGIKHGLRSWLNIEPAGPYAIQINEIADFEMNAIRNKIWYSADGNKIEQMYMQSPEYADKHKFWASKCSPGMEMRKIHTGLPALMIRVLTSIVVSGMQEFEFENGGQKDLWDEMEKDSKFRKKFEKSLKDVLVIGDGAFKISIDTGLTPYPIIEWYSGEKMEIVRQRDRLQEIIFKTEYKVSRQRFVLNEHYGYGYVQYHLYRGETEVELATVPALAGLQDVTFDKTLMLAVPLQVYESSTYEGRGGSIYDGKADAFDAFDEAWSQWMDALRAGRSKTYIPECLVPHDPATGKLIKPNAFDNRYFAADGDMREGQKNVISTDQPNIPHDSYMASYITALDLCLQGIISPSTLGIDTKKLDNADAQREKEKTTLYTRNAIIDALQETLPELVSVCINASRLMSRQTMEEVNVNIKFKEYANPSFESQVETVVKARQGGIMSVERSVEELYGDSLDEHCKEEEIQRLKAEQGIADMTEPAVNMQAGPFTVYGGVTDEGDDRKKGVQDEPEGVSGDAGDGKGAGTAGSVRRGKEQSGGASV